MKLPIISLWQPWGQWVSLGWKPIETRTHARFKHLLGKRIGIHLALKWDKSAIETALPFLSEQQIRSTEGFLRIGGAVVCTAHVSEFRPLTRVDAKLALIECETPRFGLVLRDIERIESAPMKGRQGVWYADLEGATK